MDRAPPPMFSAARRRAAAGGAAAALRRQGAHVIERLIQEARALPRVSQRIDFISGKLLGIRYRADTLIGRPEASGEIRRPRRRLRLRDVLRGGAGRRHRPRHRANSRPRCAASATTTARCNTTSAIIISPTGASATSRTASAGRSRSSRRSTIDKTVTWHREFGKRHVSMTAIAKATLLDNAKLLAPGDIIGFTSRRASLDYYHTGLDRLRQERRTAAAQRLAEPRPRASKRRWRRSSPSIR